MAQETDRKILQRDGRVKNPEDNARLDRLNRIAREGKRVKNYSDDPVTYEFSQRHGKRRYELRATEPDAKRNLTVAEQDESEWGQRTTAKWRRSRKGAWQADGATETWSVGGDTSFGNYGEDPIPAEDGMQLVRLVDAQIVENKDKK